MPRYMRSCTSYMMCDAPCLSYLMCHTSNKVIFSLCAQWPASYKRTMDHDLDPQSVNLPTDKEWEELAKNIVRAEMMRRGVSFAKLPELLEAMGISDNEPNLRNKVGRGRFSAVFFLQCMKALGVDWIQIPDSVNDAAKPGGAQTLAKGGQDKSRHAD